MEKFDRRQFLQLSAGTAGAALLAGALPAPMWAAQAKSRAKLPVAAVVSVYHVNSHADVIVGKVLEGWKQDGGLGPDLELVALYVDQFPENDISRALAAKHGVPIMKTIEEALTLGKGELAVAGVISVGEHGNYPQTPDTHQVMYPRRRFFDEIVATFEKYKKVVPVFNDKHLGYAWEDAKHMYDTAKRMNFPLMAGSSLPVAWRSPSASFPIGTELTGALALGYGPLEAYGFHATEGLQCMAERRKGGETGVASVQAVKGEEIQRALEAGRWSRELLDAIASVTPPIPSGRTKELNKDSVFYLVEYLDGLRGGVAMDTNVSYEFAFAGQPKADPKPWATWYRFQEDKPFGHFEFLLRGIEYMIHEGKQPYPVERTLLTTGILDAAMHSLADGGKRIETPHLAVKYEPVNWPFAEGLPPK